MPEPIQQPTEKVVFEFQHTDENGQPIIDPRTGKPAFTNLVGKDWQEIAEKQKESYLNVTRALARARNHKPVPKEPDAVRQELSPEEERQAIAEVNDPVKGKAAIRKLAGVDEIEARQKEAEKAKFNADVKAAQFQFMSQHLNDYYPCQANSVVLLKYVTENELDPRSVDNYEIALNAVGPSLAPRPAPQTRTPVNEPEPEPKPRASTGGIVPGEATGQRPARKIKNEVTRESINDMRRTPEGRAQYKKRMRDPEFVKQVNAAFQT